jgi:hypothetical protein
MVKIEPSDSNWRYTQKLNEVITKVNAQNEHLLFLDRFVYEIQDRRFWHLIFLIFFTDFLKKWPRWKERDIKYMDIPPDLLTRMGEEQAKEIFRHPVNITEWKPNNGKAQKA